MALLHDAANWLRQAQELILKTEDAVFQDGSSVLYQENVVEACSEARERLDLALLKLQQIASEDDSEEDQA